MKTHLKQLILIATFTCASATLLCPPIAEPKYFLDWVYYENSRTEQINHYAEKHSVTVEVATDEVDSFYYVDSFDPNTDNPLVIVYRKEPYAPGTDVRTILNKSRRNAWIVHKYVGVAKANYMQSSIDPAFITAFQEETQTVRTVAADLCAQLEQTLEHKKALNTQLKELNQLILKTETALHAANDEAQRTTHTVTLVQTIESLGLLLTQLKNQKRTLITTLFKEKRLVKSQKRKTLAHEYLASTTQAYSQAIADPAPDHAALLSLARDLAMAKRAADFCDWEVDSLIEEQDLFDRYVALKNSVNDMEKRSAYQAWTEASSETQEAYQETKLKLTKRNAFASDDIFILEIDWEGLSTRVSPLAFSHLYNRQRAQARAQDLTDRTQRSWVSAQEAAAMRHTAFIESSTVRFKEAVESLEGGVEVECNICHETEKPDEANTRLLLPFICPHATNPAALLSSHAICTGCFNMIETDAHQEARHVTCPADGSPLFS